MDLFHAEPFSRSGAYQPADLFALLGAQCVGLVPGPVRQRDRRRRAGRCR